MRASAGPSPARAGRTSSSGSLMRHLLPALPKSGELGVGELAPAARLEPVGVERAVLETVQPPDRVADGGEHPLYLVLAALVDRELDSARAEPACAGGRGTAVVELDTLLESEQRVVG